jgi:hypothetical protein
MQDASSVFQSGSRPNPSGRWAWYNSKNNIQAEAIIHSVGPLEQLEGSAVAFVPSLNEYVKVQGLEFDASANGIGTTSPLTTGDRVIISYTEGYSSRPKVLQIKTDGPDIKEFLLQPGHPVPTPDTLFKGRTLNGRPTTFIPEAVKFAGRITAVIDRLEGLPGRENSPTSGNQVFNSLPGSARWSNPLGDYTMATIGTLTEFAADEVKAITSPLVDGVTLPIAKATHYLSFVRDTIRKYRTGQFRFNTSLSVNPETDDSLAVNLRAGNLLAGDSQTIFNDTLNQALFNLQVAEQESKKKEDFNDCIKGNVSSIQNRAQGFFKGLLQQALKGNLNPLNKINQILPQSLQLSVTSGTDGLPKSLGLGDLSLDLNTQKIKSLEPGGKTYDPFIKAGVQEVNKVLPNYLKATVTPDSLQLGSTVLRAKDIKEGELSVAPGIKVNSAKGKVSITVGSKAFDVSTLTAEGLLSSAEGLAGLNQKYPDLMQVSAKDSKIQIGPVEVDLEDFANFSFDAVKARELSGVFAENQVLTLFSQLPAPAQMAARALWKAGDFGTLLNGLIKPRNSADDKIISLEESLCKGLKGAIPPLINTKLDFMKVFNE